jgi:hypothetical protein
MVSPWWGLGVAVPATMAIRAFSGRGKGQNREDEPLSRQVTHSIALVEYAE